MLMTEEEEEFFFKKGICVVQGAGRERRGTCGLIVFCLLFKL